MKREDIINELDRAPSDCFREGTQVELTSNVILDINAIFNFFENKKCIHCKYLKQNSIKFFIGACALENVGMIKDEDFGCNRWESK